MWAQGNVVYTSLCQFSIPTSLSHIMQFQKKCELDEGANSDGWFWKQIASVDIK